MAKYKRSESELVEALQEQRLFLRASCASYDAGMLSEAMRIATAIYVIAFDGSTNNSKSLLGQLKLKSSFRFINSSLNVPDNTIPQTHLARLVVIDHTKPPQFLPLCYRERHSYQPTKVSFSAWWEEAVIEQVTLLAPKGAKKKISMSRKNLVFRLRNVDGGAHFDPYLREEFYTVVSAGDGIGIHSTGRDGTKVILRPHLATMRQMGWELEQSLASIPGGPDIKPPPPFTELQARLRGQS